MLEKIREGSQGTWAVVILGLVILSFVFAGVGGYVSSSSNAAASVNGSEISQTTFDRAYQNERARMEAQFGESFSILAADTAYLNQFRKSILDRLIADKLMEQAAEEIGLRVSDEQIRESIVNMPEFQVGQSFDNERFKATLRQVGFQPSTFKDYLRSEMTRQQFVSAMLGSEFSLKSEASKVLSLQLQTRDIQYFSVPSADFASSVEVNDQDIEVYYQQNLAQFDTQEKVSLEYIELNADDLMSGIEVTEQEVEDLYNRSSNDFQTAEQRKLSLILIEFGDDEEAARAKAEATLARVRGGEDFAKVASEVSDDAFSAENGGDLDFIARGDMDSEFEDAAFNLENVGDITDIVESDFGLQIIKLTEIKDQQVTPFAEVKDTLTEQVRREKAVEEFFILQNTAAELAFEMPNGLVEVAEALDTEVKSTELFTQNAPPAEVSSPLVVNQAFSEELIADRVNSELISIGENNVMIIRVKEHEAERTKSLDEVKPEIVIQLTAQKAQEAAKAWAQSLLADLQDGTDISDKLAEKNLGWELQADVARFGSEIPAAIVDKVFQLSANPEQNKAVVELANGDIGVVQLNNVNSSAALPAEQVIAMQRQLGQMQSQTEITNLIEALKAKADIEVYIQ
ncbi:MULTISPECIES: SurA N-terminal domain-containing protein [Aliiglaciecola]|uniref:SurA N-terminal domain-containing protein n=1 Tax=Aliiglaciecola TaxID=1406885 RepID=UPI001C0991FC|nr:MULTISPECIES: SurA N-terminal domain-containing protein [Aliiglaciecola]MBU2879693.1 SurA N-terminal domain-containing protein [Aliiglaciecola lipolytica]MDO6710028.1 SurA N-terminal domain-containing protein [Aliiglaciecola sp. 2_MG-2023]MDO6751176.1 SurA N-terminal domain-containing protein [Aliiglaciecola sp. 1_MG-2023]